MEKIPQEALDLYAWAVDLCSANGYPLDKLRVRWTVEETGKDGDKWKTMYHYPRTFEGRPVGWGSIGHPADQSLNDLLPEGVLFEFDDAAEAQNLGFALGTEDIPTVRVLPPHTWLAEGVVSSEVTARCSVCREEVRFRYNAWDWEKNRWSTGKQILIPITEGHIPVCIRRHRPLTYQVSTDGSYPEYRVGCEMCRNDLVAPPAFAQWQMDRMQSDSNMMVARRVSPRQEPFAFTREYIRSLGRCPFDPSAVWGGRFA